MMHSASLIQAPIRTRYGIFSAYFSEIGLARLEFPRKFELLEKTPDLPPAQAIRWRKQTEQALNQALRNGRPSDLPPFDLRSGTDFQRRVWAALQTIDAGETLTYASLAALIHHPRAVRAAGGACGANPIPVLIPCHRVLAASRKIGGFSGGLRWKERLLAIEGHQDFAAACPELNLFNQAQEITEAA
ncbi:MAG: methylated-DNA--[protein]-cysteine S-methyltransferase [Limisphaerales bacterium]